MSILSRLLPGHRLSIKTLAVDQATPVDTYWSQHTVNSEPFKSAAESEAYLKWRNEQYPLFPEFMEMWGDHHGQVVLDYGCGPGNDLVGFLLYGGAARVIGVDVSPKALELAKHRLELHQFRRSTITLIRGADASSQIPLPEASVDYINCSGVIHHTSNPEAILAEFARVLKAGGRGRIMVYNRQSLWYHLYVAYMRMILEGLFPGLTDQQAFGRSTDGEECPISIPYDPNEFLRLLAQAGLRADFIGGYLSVHELNCWQEHGSQAVADDRLGQEHRSFLSDLDFDSSGYPRWHGKHAGIGGVYALKKP